MLISCHSLRILYREEWVCYIKVMGMEMESEENLTKVRNIRNYVAVDCLSNVSKVQWQTEYQVHLPAQNLPIIYILIIR